MASYPVRFDVTRPDRFERFHVVVRVLLLALLTMLGGSLGWMFGLLLLALPAYAAVQSSVKGGARYLVEDGPRVARVLRWVMALYAYLALLTDKVPDRHYADNIHYGVETEGNPTPGNALWRLVASIPGLFFLLVVGIISSVLWLIAMVSVALIGKWSASLYEMQVGVYRFMGRLLAYHASLVDTYPPFTLKGVESRDDTAHPRAA